MFTEPKASKRELASILKRLLAGDLEAEAGNVSAVLGTQRDPRVAQLLEQLAQRIRAQRALIETLRTAPSPAYDLGELSEQSCVACGGTDLFVTRYPLYSSSFFAGRLKLHCRRCGLAWEPTPNLDLEDYYSSHYAKEFRKERARKGRFHSDDNPFWRKPGSRILERARKHVALLEAHQPLDRVMDLGAGEGVFLSLCPAREKFAQEYDQGSRRILREELGVTLVNVAAHIDFFDAVVASHSLEHLTYDTVIHQLRTVLAALKPGGVFLAEVPPGATQLEAFIRGDRPPSRRMEPHTLHISSVSLRLMLQAAGFELLSMSVCAWTRRNHPGFADVLATSGIERIQTGTVIALARRPVEDRGRGPGAVDRGT